MSGPWVGGGWTSLDCEDEDGWTSGHPGSWFGIRLSKALLRFSGGRPTESHFVKLLRSPGPPTVPTFSSQVARPHCPCSAQSSTVAPTLPKA